MFETDYMLFCAAKSANPNGNFSLHEIFDGIFASQFPARHTPFLVTAQLRAKKAVVDKDLQVRLDIELRAKQVSTSSIVAHVTTEKGNSISFDIDLSAWVIPEAGDYQFKLYIDDKLYNTRLLRVRNSDDFVEK